MKKLGISADSSKKANLITNEPVINKVRESMTEITYDRDIIQQEFAESKLGKRSADKKVKTVEKKAQVKVEGLDVFIRFK